MFNTTRLGTRKSYLAWLLVILQFTFIGLVLVTTPLLNLKLWVGLLVITGIAGIIRYIHNSNRQF